jgi:flagellar hook-associated protein 3 FlgL
MVAMRVATFAQSNKMIADAMRVQSVMAEKQVQDRRA